MPSALSRRFTHITLEPDVPDWCRWALSSGKILPELVQSGDPKKSERVMKALMQMKKLDVAKLQEAAEQE